MLRRVVLVRTEVSEELGTSDSCQPDDGGAKLLRNVGCYKSHKS
jgi:hypothetical protein